MTIQFSRRLAIVIGILAPVGETIRRWSTWKQDPPSLFDDYILGAFLLYAHEQGVCHRLLEVEDLFPKQVLSSYRI